MEMMFMLIHYQIHFHLKTKAKTKTIINSYHSHFDELSWETFLSISEDRPGGDERNVIIDRKESNESDSWWKF